MSRLRMPVSAADHYLGNPEASIVLVEYGDFECPHCRHAHTLIKQLVKERGDEIHFVFRNFPLREFHPYANMAALAAEAAGRQGKFWEMHDLIFENQEKLSPDFLLEMASRMDLNLARFAEDTNSEDIQAKVDMDFESGIRSGVNGTPTFFLNGSRVLTYDGSYESLKDAIHVGSELKGS